MSNLIKAYSVNYDEPTKKLDMNERAENFRRLYVERLEKQASDDTAEGEYAPDDGFVEGITGDRVIRPVTVISVVPLILEIPLMGLSSFSIWSLMSVPGCSGLKVFFTFIGMFLTQTGYIVGG